jgi:hypothetical protein
MSRLLLGTVVLLGAAGPAWAGATDYFTEFTKDFGITPRGPQLVHYFTVKNSTNQTVTIGQVRVSCGCVSADMLKYQLAPGESTAVRAVMDTRRIPQANVVKAVTVYVPFLSPSLEEVALKVQAIARDDLVMTPESLAFGTVRKGQPGSASVKVTFYSDPSWEIKEVTSTGAYIKPTAKLVSREGRAVTYEIAAALDAACPVGDWTADVWLKTSNAAVEKLRIPVRVTVVAPLAANPDAVSLSDLKVGDSIEHRVVIRGNQAFKVLEVKGGDDVVKVKPASDEALPVHVLTILVSPKAAGELARTLEIVTDHKEQARLSLPFRAVVGKR